MRWDWVLMVITLLAAVGSGLIAGVFYAFSTFVMKALGRRPAEAGMAAMQAINVAVINPMFMGVFMGTTLVSLAAAVGAVWMGSRATAPLTLAGAGLYVLGCFGVTIAFNVPLNNALAAAEPAQADAEGIWADYQQRWTTWNHVRTAASLGAMVLFILALLQRS